MEMISSPCKDCQKREIGCHSKCKHYIEFRHDLDEINKMKEAEKDGYPIMHAPIVREIWRRMKLPKIYQ